LTRDLLPAIVDGEVRPDGRVDVLVLGGGLQQGEGLFETLPVVGGRPHFLERHAARLAGGARELELDPAPDAATWAADLRTLTAAAACDDLAARLLLFRDGAVVRRAVAAQPLSLAPLTPARIGPARSGLAGARPLAHLKTLNYLGPRRAHAEGVKDGFDEVLFVLDDGTVLEGSRSSVFMVRGGVLTTPPLTLPILPGVTREVLLEIARDEGLRAVEEPFTVADLGSADEVFLTASLRGVRPVATVSDRPVAAAPGPVTARLSELYGARASRGR